MKTKPTTWRSIIGILVMFFLSAPTMLFSSVDNALTHSIKQEVPLLKSNENSMDAIMQMPTKFLLRAVENEKTEFMEYPYIGQNIPYASINDREGNMYITGSSSNLNQPCGNMIIIKVNVHGKVVWERRLPVDDYVAEMGLAITLDKRGNPIASGVYWNGHDMDVQTMKLHKENGSILWRTVYDGGNEGLDVPMAMVTDHHDNVVVTGITHTGTNIEYLTLKYDSIGNQLWAVADEYGIKDIRLDPNAIAVDADGNIAVAGFGSSEDYYKIYYTIKYKPDGTLAWKQKHLYERPKTEADPDSEIIKTNSEVYDVAFDEEGNCYVTGIFDTSAGRIGTIKYSASGEREWIQIYRTGVNSTTGNRIEVKSDTVYVAGKHSRSTSAGGLILASYSTAGEKNWIAETSDLYNTADIHLSFTEEKLPVVFGRGTKPGASSNHFLRTLKYSLEGEILKQVDYLRIKVSTFGIHGLIGAGLDKDENIYLAFETFYTSYGGAFEYAKMSMDTEGNTPLWNDFHHSPMGASNTRVLQSKADKEGNTYIAGTFSFIENDALVANYYIAKYNAEGVLEWRKAFNKNDGLVSNGILIDVNHRGEPIVYLVPSSLSGNNPVGVKKLSPSGDVLWEAQKQLAGSPNINRLFTDGQGNVYLAGNAKEISTEAKTKFTIMKYSDTGEELWTKFVFVDETSTTHSVGAGAADTHGNIVITGAYGIKTMMSESVSYVTFQLAPDGDLNWMQKVPKDGFNSTGTELHIDEQSNIYVCGLEQSKTAGKNECLTVRKLSASGEELWYQTYSEYESEGRRIRPYNIMPLSTGEVVVSGFSVIDGLNNRIVIVKYDAKGERKWIYQSEFQRFYNDMFVDEKDNTYILTQLNKSTVPHRLSYSTGPLPYAGVLKINPEGIELEEKEFDTPEVAAYFPAAFAPHADGRLLITGYLNHELSFFCGAYFFEMEHEKIEPTLYTITTSVEPAEGGIITPSGDLEFDLNDEVEFIITPNEGYEIGDVLVDEVSVGQVNKYKFERIAGNHSIKVEFVETAAPVYIVTASVEPAEGGVITPSGRVEVAANDDALFAITPNENYDIEDVLVDGVSIGKVDEYNFEKVSEDHSIKVVFALKQDVGTVDRASAVAYPNPTSGKVYINIREAGKSIQVFDITGRMLKEVGLDDGSIDLSDVPQGIYLLKVEEQSIKVVKR